MKRSTYIQMIDYIKHSNPKPSNYFGIKKLIEIFSENEIECYEDLKKLYEFIGFLNDDYDKYIPITEFYLDFLFLSMSISQQLSEVLSQIFGEESRAFIDKVEPFLPYGKDTNVLDVGAGQYPLTSIMLAQDVENVTAIDKLFFLSENTLKKLNVEAKMEKFNENTDISEYDMIMAKRPCEATVDLISNCAKNNKPYLVELCRCAIPNMDIIDTKDKIWKGYLKDIDPRIRFFKTNFYKNDYQYAYALDATPEQIKRAYELVEKFRKHDFIFSVLELFANRYKIKE